MALVNMTMSVCFPNMFWFLKRLSNYQLLEEGPWPFLLFGVLYKAVTTY
jgi:hypothetical protein